MSAASSIASYCLLLAIASFGAGMAGALLTARRDALCRQVAHGCALLGSLFTLACGLSGLSGGTLHITLAELLPLAGGVTLDLDGLGAFFILLIGAGAIPATLYAVGYTRAYEGRRSLAASGFALNAFLAAMLLVVVSGNVLTFLVVWELMALASYFLVMTESERAETQSAGWVYLVMTHCGFACLLAGFLILLHATGSMQFGDWPALAARLDERTRSLVFMLLAAGFGSKAGVIPLHIWLPQAHPAAPSHVSALMSSVMVKLGIYGLLRVTFAWLGAGPEWWGLALLAFGSLSAVLGVLYALVESDLKRLLAYSTIENVGIILLGTGAAMLFKTHHADALAALALTAALFHAFNHTLFKSLLFMAAGAVLHATQTRNMEAMGGLIRHMPQTAALFLTGALAIAALPPLNGFAGEWLTFQALLLSFRIPSEGINLVFALAIAALALTGGLAAACFVKAFGIPFLALPRSEAAGHAHEVDRWMRGAMLLPALACFALGILPGGALAILEPLTFGLAGAHADLGFDFSTLSAGGQFATLSPLSIALVLGILLLALPIGLRLARVNRTRRTYETWGCGREVQTARFEYTASAFSNPFKRVFSVLYRPVKALDIEFHPGSRFFIETIKYSNETRSIIDDALYAPFGRLAHRLAAQARRVQSGNVHSYLLYILAALVVLLLVTR